MVALLKNSGLASLLVFLANCGDVSDVPQSDATETDTASSSDGGPEEWLPDSGLGSIELRPIALWGKRGGPGNQAGFGGAGGGPDDLNDPTGIGVSQDESEIYVVDSGNDRIKVYDPNGAVLRTFPHSGSVNDLVVGLDGTLYTWSRESKAVVGYDSFGLLRYRWSLLDGGTSDTGYSFSVGTDGLIYIADSVFGQISVYSAEGEYLRRMGSRGELKGEVPNGPNGLAVVGSDVYGSSFGELLVFSSTGQYRYNVTAPTYEPTRTYGGEGGLAAWKGWCVALAWNQGTAGYGFYAIEPGASEITHVAAITQGIGIRQMDLPTNFVIDSRGRWYVTERNNHRVQILQGSME